MCQLGLAELAVTGRFCRQVINYVDCTVLKVRVGTSEGLDRGDVLFLVWFCVSGLSEANSIHSSNNSGLMANIFPCATAYSGELLDKMRFLLISGG